jgi:hypothetical protein
MPVFFLMENHFAVDVQAITAAGPIRDAIFALQEGEQEDELKRFLSSACSAIFFGFSGKLIFGVFVTGGILGLEPAFGIVDIQLEVKEQIFNSIAAAVTSVAHESVFKLESVLRDVYLNARRVLPKRDSSESQILVQDLVANEVGAVFIVGGARFCSLGCGKKPDRRNYWRCPTRH